MQFLINKLDILFKPYSNESHPNLKATKYNSFTKTRNSVMSKKKKNLKTTY